MTRDAFFRVAPVALAACAALTACPPPPEVKPPPPPPVEGCQVDTNFPTRDATSAVDLEASTPITGTLCPARDDDGYRVHANAGDVLVVTLSMGTNFTNVSPAYGLFKDNGDGTMDPLGIFDGDPNDTQGHVTNFTSAHRVDDTADYIVDVRDFEGLDDGFDNVNEYTLVVDVVPDPDANEPNNLPDQATPVTPGTPINGIIATSGDLDYYAIEVSAAAQIIDVTIDVPAGSGVQHVATLLLPDALTVLQTAPLAADPADATKETVRLRKAASTDPAGPYLLLVQAGGDTAATDAQLDPALGQYTVNVSVLADPDANEGAGGNESVDTATTVTSGQTVTASLASFADQDVYRVTPPGGTSRNTPQVLVVTVTFDGTLSPDFQPQLAMITADPEDGAPVACAQAPNQCVGVDPATNHTHVCYDNKCGTEMLQRFIKTSPFKTAFPLRTAEPVFVSVNELNDDAFQETGGYTIQFQVVPDPDTNEHGDDFLIPNLEFAGFADTGNNVTAAEAERARQREQSKQRARVVDTGYQPLCAAPPTTIDQNLPADDQDPTCIDVEAVPNPVGFNFPANEANCGDPAAGSVSRTFSGRLSYEGDRDFFKLDHFPSGAYWGINVNYTIDRTTPVELAVFVHGDNGSALAGSTLEATQTGGCSEQEGGQNACAPGSVCVDSRCWTDGDSNPAHTVDFGDGPDECIVSAGGSVNVDAPLYIEVVDNGINDFDLDMTYTITATITCGCPANCDTGQDFCQNG